MFRRSLLAVASVSAAAALALAGCSSSGGGGSSSAPGGSSGSGSGSSSASPTAVASIAAQVPSAIKSKGTLTFALDATYPPGEFVADDGHTLTGVDVDLARQLAAVMGLKADIKNVKFDSIIIGLASGKYDVGLSSFTDNKEREKTVDFVTYFEAGEGFYVKSGSDKSFTNLASLCGHKVAVESGTIEADDANAQKKKCSLTVLTFADQNAANLAVSSGRADVGFVDSQVAGYIVEKSNGQFELSGKPFAVAPYGIALPKNNGLAPAVKAALEKLIADGSYKAVLTKWGVEDGAITTPVVNGATS